MDRGLLEQWLAEGRSLEDIGRTVDRDPSTVSYWLRKYGLEAAHREKHRAKGGLPLEELKALVEAGSTQREMAENFGVAVRTVRYWLKKYGLKTAHGEQYGLNPETKSPRVTRRCRRHGLTTYVLSRAQDRTRYRCIRCRSERVSERRRKVKRILVQEAGGRCRLCGYDRSPAALHFHHVDPSQKRFEVSLQGEARALEQARAEARKCVLLCATCHAEVEAGVAILPTNALHGPFALQVDRG